MTYNGWKNYETWVTSMYLDGNYDGEAIYREVLALARHVRIDSADLRTAQYRLARILREFVTERIVPEESGLAADLLGSVLDDVDWDTLAEHKLEENE